MMIKLSQFFAILVCCVACDGGGGGMSTTTTTTYHSSPLFGPSSYSPSPSSGAPPAVGYIV